MKKYAFAFTGILLSVILAACNITQTCIDGSGEVISENRNVTYFESINLATGGNVFISQGNENSVQIETNKDVLQQLTTQVENETLIIDCEKAICPAKLNIYVTVKDLTSVNLTGSGNIFNFTPIQSDNLIIKTLGSGTINFTDLKATNLGIMSRGSGDINVEGIAKASIVEVNGSGNVNALDLTSEYLNVTLNGSGEATAKVENKIIANINGSGDLKYIGDPTDKKFNKNGTGNIKKVKAIG